MSTIDKLMSDAQTQLDEHKVWLKQQMHEWMNTQDGGEWKLQFRVLIQQVEDIKLRMSRADEDNITIVWEFPDELIVYLSDEKTPAHIRKALEGGRVVDMNQPGFEAKRAPESKRASS